MEQSPALHQYRPTASSLGQAGLGPHRRSAFRGRNSSPNSYLKVNVISKVIGKDVTPLAIGVPPLLGSAEARQWRPFFHSAHAPK
jgi:hypothetical protein